MPNSISLTQKSDQNLHVGFFLLGRVAREEPEASFPCLCLFLRKCHVSYLGQRGWHLVAMSTADGYRKAASLERLFLNNGQILISCYIHQLKCRLCHFVSFLIFHSTNNMQSCVDITKGALDGLGSLQKSLTVAVSLTVCIFINIKHGLAVFLDFS